MTEEDANDSNYESCTCALVAEEEDAEAAQDEAAPEGRKCEEAAESSRLKKQHKNELTLRYL